MGVILDSSVLIAGERRKESVREILNRVRAGPRKNVRVPRPERGGRMTISGVGSSSDSTGVQKPDLVG